MHVVAMAAPAKISAQNDLLSLAVALGADQVRGWSLAEKALIVDLPKYLPLFESSAISIIERGEDPLGDAFCRIFSSDERRPQGATYTPASIIESMMKWAANQVRPVRIVDPGTGSARFLVAAGRRFPEADLIGVEIDPMAAILARGHLAAAGMASRSQVFLEDYRSLQLPETNGPTLFIGNPPYVRHHLIDTSWKKWLTETARRLGLEASQLSGLHVYFFLATAIHAKPGDIGVLITAAEWLDVNYGRLVRELLLEKLGAKSIHVIEPTAEPFPGTQATAAITGFEIGTKPASIGMRRVDELSELGALETNWKVGRERLETAHRWTPLTRINTQRREGFVELGELCRVHRGQVTGSNKIWVSDANEHRLPESVLFASVTKARELFSAGGVLSDGSWLRQVIDLPVDLDVLETDERKLVDQFIRFAKRHGADQGFVASHRKAWWSVGLRESAPILATYMARRPPVFVRNLVDARHINIAHGLYPRTELTSVQLDGLAGYLSSSVSLHEGRTYAGGLTKFEPREMERLLVPTPEFLFEPITAGQLA